MYLWATTQRWPIQCYTALAMAEGREGRSRVWIWLLVGGGLFSMFAVAVVTLVYLSFGGNEDDSFSGFGDKIGVVDLEGVILSPKLVVSQIKKFADDDSIKAIILHVNSPGGGVAESLSVHSFSGAPAITRPARKGGYPTQ